MLEFVLLSFDHFVFLAFGRVELDYFSGFLFSRIERILSFLFGLRVGETF